MEVGLKPWRLDGFEEDTKEVNVIQFWYARLMDYLDARARVQAKLRADPTFAKARDRAMVHGGLYGDLPGGVEALEHQDPDGAW